MGNCEDFIFEAQIFVADKEAGSYVPLTCERRREIKEVWNSRQIASRYSVCVASLFSFFFAGKGAVLKGKLKMSMSSGQFSVNFIRHFVFLKKFPINEVFMVDACLTCTKV